MSTNAAHLWLANLDTEVVGVFGVAFTLSAKKRGYRVSTERFLAALPDQHKEMVRSLCEDAGCDCKMAVGVADLPAPALPADWQEKICFSTCIEATLVKCGPGTNLIAFLRLLSTTAVRLHCVMDRSMPVSAYISETRLLQPPALASHIPPPPPGPPPPPPPPRPPPQMPSPDRWQSHAPTVFSVDDHLGDDVLLTVMAKASSIEALRKCKTVCKSWRRGARVTLCDVSWLLANNISLHDLLKKGNPSPHLVLALAAERPSCMHERDGEGLLPLQYAAAYRMDADLVAAIRQATAARVPGSAAWANSAEARSIKSQLRPVRTRVVHGPIAA